jgi:acyl carrier protein
MTDEQLLTAVRRALGPYTEIPSDKIKPPVSLADLGVDSLTAVGVVADLEESLGITIPNEEALEVKTVGDVIERLRRHLGGSGDSTVAVAG